MRKFFEDNSGGIDIDKLCSLMPLICTMSEMTPLRYPRFKCNVQNWFILFTGSCRCILIKLKEDNSRDQDVGQRIQDFSAHECGRI